MSVVQAGQGKFCYVRWYKLVKESFVMSGGTSWSRKVLLCQMVQAGQESIVMLDGTSRSRNILL
jgi:hypothetical protein